VTMATKATCVEDGDKRPWLDWDFSFCCGDLLYYPPVGTQWWLNGIPRGFQPREGCRFGEKPKPHLWNWLGWWQYRNRWGDYVKGELADRVDYL